MLNGLQQMTSRLGSRTSCSSPFQDVSPFKHARTRTHMCTNARTYPCTCTQTSFSFFFQSKMEKLSRNHFCAASVSRKIAPLGRLETATGALFVLESRCLLKAKEELQHSVRNEQEVQPWVRSHPAYRLFQKAAAYL